MSNIHTLQDMRTISSPQQVSHVTLTRQEYHQLVAAAQRQQRPPPPRPRTWGDTFQDGATIVGGVAVRTAVTAAVGATMGVAANAAVSQLAHRVSSIPASVVPPPMTATDVNEAGWVSVQAHNLGIGPGTLTPPTPPWLPPLPPVPQTDTTRDIVDTAQTGAFVVAGEVAGETAGIALGTLVGGPVGGIIGKFAGGVAGAAIGFGVAKVFHGLF